MKTKLLVAILLTVVLPAGFFAPVVTADDWLPITPEDLAMKDYAPSPGSHAVLLYREVRTDDVNSVENNYIRIKILTEEGKKYGNVELAYFRNFNKIGDIKARTIRPDGTILKFDGEVFEKTLVKARGAKIQAKTFSFPEVQVGSIIEYRYTSRWDLSASNSPKWLIQHELPTKAAKFWFKPFQQAVVSYVSFRLPSGKKIAQNKDSSFSLDLQEIAPFKEESHMPPEDEEQTRVEFFYFAQNPESPEKFWKRVGQELHQSAEDYIGNRGGIKQAAAQLVAPTDDPEARLRKIYAHLQGMRNLSYERSKTEKELRQEGIKDNNNIEDVWKRNYGWRHQLTYLFVGLARAAGLESSVVFVSERDVQFFSEMILSSSQLDGRVALVKVGNEERYFDPSTPNCPFGQLNWLRTGVRGLRPGKDGGQFITTPQPASTDAVATRTAVFKLDEEGNLKGNLQLTFTGLEALTRRLDTMESDETGRRKGLEDEIKQALPASAVVKLGKVTGWSGFDQPLVAEAAVEIQGFAIPAGRRLLLPTNIYQAQEANPFPQSDRIHPVYFRHPFREIDEITYELPAGFKATNLPAPTTQREVFAAYQVIRATAGNRVTVKRTLFVEGILFPLQYYSALRSFFSQVRTHDEEQVVLQAVAAASK